MHRLIYNTNDTHPTPNARRYEYMSVIDDCGIRRKYDMQLDLHPSFSHPRRAMVLS